MLQDVRKSMQGTTAKVIVWLIAITFALFGVESIVGGIGGEPEIAEINGEGIAESEFKIALERKRRQVLTQMGDAADASLINDALLSSSVLNGLIQEKILLLDAQEKGLYIPQQMIDQYIRELNDFKTDGEFDNSRMQMTLGSAGFTLQGFRNTLAKQFMLDQNRGGLIASAFVLDQEEAELIAIDRQERSFGSAILKRIDYAEKVEVNSNDVQQYYSENSAIFRKSESVDVAYVVLDKNNLSEEVSVSDEEVNVRYETEIADFIGEEQRRASHILITIDESLDEAAALAKAQSLANDLNQGADFSELAKINSQDESSAVEGGDLGFSGKGVYVSEFEDILFQLGINEISEPVKTEFGYHLIKLVEIQTNEPPSLQEMKESLVAQLKEEKLDVLFVELSQQLADVSYSASDLAEPAEELALDVRTLASVSAETSDPIFSDRRVQKDLFDSELRESGNNSDLIELADGRAIVFRVEGYNEASDLPIDQVAGEIEALLKNQKSAEFAASVGQAFVVRVEAGEQASAVAEDLGLDWVEYSQIRRDNADLLPELVMNVFAMPEPVGEGTKQVAGFDVNDGDFAIVSLARVESGDAELILPVERRSIARTLGSTYGGADYSSYLVSIENGAEIERL